MTRQIHAQRHVDRMLRNAAVRATHMHDNAVKIHDWPHRFQRPEPRRDFLVHGVGEAGNQRCREFHAVERFHQLLDVALLMPLA